MLIHAAGVAYVPNEYNNNNINSSNNNNNENDVDAARGNASPNIELLEWPRAPRFNDVHLAINHLCPTLLSTPSPPSIREP